MGNTLTITVNYDKPNFSYALSYTDGDRTEWTDTLADGDTVMFTENGKYTLTKKGTREKNTFEFDAVNVQLGSSLSNCPSSTCEPDPVSFDLGGIEFPALTTGSEVVKIKLTWCQATSSNKDQPGFKDPKLGLSNTTGTKGDRVVNFPSCTCPTSPRRG